MKKINTKKTKISDTIFTMVMIIASLIFIFPVFWTITMSFKPREDIFTNTPPLLPSTWTLQNFKEVFGTSGAGYFFINSMKVSACTVVIVVILAATCGYGIYRLGGKTAGHISMTLLMLRMIPVMVLTIPFYIMFKTFGWINSLPALALCYTALSLPLAIWLCYGFYLSIPDGVIEAAIVDGANEFHLFTRIGLPLVGNSLVVIVLQTFFFAWNELTLAMILMSKTEKRTIAVGIKYWTANTLETPYARMAAAGVVCIIPTIIITVFTQKYLVKGFVAGAVKE